MRNLSSIFLKCCTVVFTNTTRRRKIQQGFSELWTSSCLYGRLTDHSIKWVEGKPCTIKNQIIFSIKNIVSKKAITVPYDLHTKSSTEISEWNIRRLGSVFFSNTVFRNLLNIYDGPIWENNYRLKTIHYFLKMFIHRWWTEFYICLFFLY